MTAVRWLVPGGVLVLAAVISVLAWRAGEREAVNVALTTLAAALAFVQATIEFARFIGENPPGRPRPRSNSKPRVSRGPIAIAGFISLLIGMAIYHYGVARYIEIVRRPRVWLELPTRVSVRQTTTLRWRGLNEQGDLWVVVSSALGDPSSSSAPDRVLFPQNCHSPATASGSVACILEVGGSDDAGKQFEVRVLLVDAAVRDLLGQVRNGVGFIERLPGSPRILAVETVSRY